MLSKLILSKNGLFGSLARRYSFAAEKPEPSVVFMHVNGGKKGTYGDESNIRKEMIKYAVNYSKVHQFVDPIIPPKAGELEEAFEYCERHKSSYNAFMQEEAVHITQAINESAYLAAEYSELYNKKHSLSATDFSNTILQVQWPEHSFVVGGGLGPEGGAMPEEIFQEYILTPLTKYKLSWPKHIHMDASSMLVSVTDRSASIFKKQFEKHLFCGGFGSDRPFVFNTSLLLEASEPVTLTTKHAISIDNLTVGLRTNDLSRNIRLDHDQIK